MEKCFTEKIGDCKCVSRNVVTYNARIVTVVVIAVYLFRSYTQSLMVFNKKQTKKLIRNIMNECSNERIYTMVSSNFRQ